MAARGDVPPGEKPPGASTFSQDPVSRLVAAGILQPPVRPGLVGQLDDYDILRVIGSGGMGIVLLARDADSGEELAVKTLLPEWVQHPDLVRRFRTEASHMSRLSHPAILRVLRIPPPADVPYYVMPYIRGGSLRSRLNPGGSLPVPEALGIARQVAGALVCAHARGIIHRDLKPANVLIDDDGKAYLTDFGLLRTVFNDTHVDVREPQREGTPHYMSPAVAEGKAEDTRCDIYAFGAMLYEMLTGTPPYQGPSVDGVLMQVRAGPPVPVLTANPDADRDLAYISECAMERRLRDRYAEMSDVLADLDRVERGKRPLGSRGTRVRRPSWRKTAAAMGILLAALGGGAAVHRLWTARSESPGAFAQPPQSAPLPTVWVPGRTLLRETFDGGPDLPAGWSTTNGWWRQRAGKLEALMPDPYVHSAAFLDYRPWTNYSVRFSVTVHYGSIDLLFRRTDSDTGYRLGVLCRNPADEADKPTIAFAKVFRRTRMMVPAPKEATRWGDARFTSHLPLEGYGVPTYCFGSRMIGDPVPSSLSTGTTYRVRVDVTGNRMAAFIDGREILRATDPRNPILAGTIGLTVHRSNFHNSRAEFDDLTVLSLDPLPKGHAVLFEEGWDGVTELPNEHWQLYSEARGVAPTIVPTGNPGPALRPSNAGHQGSVRPYLGAISLRDLESAAIQADVLIEGARAPYQDVFMGITRTLTPGVDDFGRHAARAVIQASSGERLLKASINDGRHEGQTMAFDRAFKPGTWNTVRLELGADDLASLYLNGERRWTFSERSENWRGGRLFIGGFSGGGPVYVDNVRVTGRPRHP